jgi:PBP1b-binding outer membrane lipoprotein LpoB
MKNLVSLLILALMLAGCASDPVEKDTQAKQYSRVTEKEFADIERNDFGRSYLEPKSNPVQKKIAAPKPSVHSKRSEHLLEVTQNLDYYCMKHRKDGRFKSEERCTHFTKSILYTCEKHTKTNAKLTACVKKYLKKGP